MKIKSAFGKTNTKDADDGDGDGGAERKVSKGEFQSMDTMVEMSTDFLQLHKKPKARPSTPEGDPSTPEGNPSTPKKNPHPSTPKPSPHPSTPKASPRASTLEKSQTLPERSSPRPTMHKSISNLIGSSLGRGLLSAGDFNSGSKDDMAVGDLKSRNNANDSEIKNALSSSLNCVDEVPKSDQDEAENRARDPDPESTNAFNGLSHSNSIPEDENDTATCSLKNGENGDVTDIDVCDIRQESMSSTELAESPDGLCEQPVDLSTHFKTISLGGDSSRFHSPKKNPPVSSAISQRSVVDSPRTSAPRRIPPVPNGSTFPRRSDAEHEQQDDNTKPASLGRKIIRQRSFEKETSVELNKEIQFWSSSSDESEPEIAQLSFNGVVHDKTSKSPAIVVDETEECSTKEEETEKRFNGDADLNSSTESLEIQVRMSPYEEGEEEEEEEFSTEMYCAIETYEVDDEMHLSKGDYVEVLERASSGWWLVQNEDGLKGWAPSNYLCPAPQVNGNTECLVPDEEVRLINKECVIGKECQKPKMSCRVIANYKGDPDNQEIDLHKGDTAHILNKTESGWWCIRDEKGDIGWAPSNYLEVSED